MVDELFGRNPESGEPEEGNGWESMFGQGTYMGLLDAYIRGDWRPIARGVSKDAIRYGAREWGPDWMVSGGSLTPAGAGVAGGAATLISKLLTGDTENLALDTAFSAGTQAAAQYAGKAAAESTGSAMAGKGVGAGVGIVASFAYDAIVNGEVSLSTGFSAIGTGVGYMLTPVLGPFGPIVGGFIGAMVGGLLSGPEKPKIYARYDAGVPVVWDATTKTFIPQRPTDFRVSVQGEDVNLDPEKKARALEGQWRQNQAYAEMMNQQFGGKEYSQMSANDAYLFDGVIDRFIPRAVPQTEDEWRAEYERWSATRGRGGEVSYDEYRRLYGQPDSFQWTRAGKTPANTQQSPYSIQSPIEDAGINALKGMSNRGRPEDQRPWGLNTDLSNSMDNSENWDTDLFNRKKEFYDTYKDKDRAGLPAETVKYLQELENDRLFIQRYNSTPAAPAVRAPDEGAHKYRAPEEEDTIARTGDGLVEEAMSRQTVQQPASDQTILDASTWSPAGPPGSRFNPVGPAGPAPVSQDNPAVASGGQNNYADVINALRRLKGGQNAATN